MAASIDPDVLFRQADRLADDLRTLIPIVGERVRAVAEHLRSTPHGPVYLVGCGDSHHAANAARMSYHSMGEVACEAVSARRFLDYDVASPAFRRGRPVVVGASASGRTPVVAEAIDAARRAGARTVALTGDAGGPVAEAARHHVALPLPGLERSPGVRTYQATLLAMLLLAAELGPAGLDGVVAELEALPEHVAATAATARAATGDIAEVIAEWGTVLVTGGGPNHGTAQFVAAKLVETAGTMAVAQDPEEWWHVERRFRPSGTPVVVLAAPGRSFEQTRAVAAAAGELGRRVVAVTGPAGGIGSRHVVPVATDTREELSPLLYHVFAASLAAQVARHLGRRAFDGDPPGFPGSLTAFRRSAIPSSD
ncbi:SIS domain-containing protein [Nonomuraea sp. NN258]|uniref:SIS domain-containing protein n=1 Tax=Nonomuraea antri TaxID=2730852 RepID=UPI0015688CE4|nr:SIS domain-containing protein [Nonomuraea antri]NRQ33097.1 SIS domain-containing protein [Nonomuraea antri]